MEDDPGYDMGANHTYRYVKTSGLGVLPYKWVGDKFVAHVQSTYDNDDYIFLIAWMKNSSYMTILSESSLFFNGTDGGTASNKKYKITVSSGILGSSSKTINSCRIPTLYQACYGTISGIQEDVIEYSNTTGCMCAIHLSFTYWLYGVTSASYRWYVRKEGYLGTSIQSNYFSVCPFAEIPY